MSYPSNWPLASHSSRYVVPRDLVQMMKDHALSSSLYLKSAGHYQQASGHAFERSEHDDHLLMLCTSGKGSLRTGQEERIVEAGDLTLLPKGLAHGYQSSVETPWSLYWVHFDGAQSDALMEELVACQDAAVCRLSGHAKWVARFEAILQVHEQGFTERATIQASSRLYRLLVELALQLAHVDSGEVKSTSFDLDGLHAYMYEHIHEQLDLDTLAEQSGLSRFHFSRQYRQATGRTPMQAFTEMKVRYACQMLDFSDASVKSISFSLGISDVYYFSRMFKKTMGYSPRQYRNLMQQNS